MSATATAPTFTLSAALPHLPAVDNAHPHYSVGSQLAGAAEDLVEFAAAAERFEAAGWGTAVRLGDDGVLCLEVRAPDGIPAEAARVLAVDLAGAYAGEFCGLDD